MGEENVIVAKSFAFGVDILKFHQGWIAEKNEYLVARQLLKSGTSIGANVEEAIGAQSSKDFLAKISIAYKEARETKYWLRLIQAAEQADESQIEMLLEECEQLLRILGSIQLTMKQKIRNS